ncbi:hypothetical protein SAMN06265365_15811, partial [Tistlia consotensis]|uniref:hypothetical protein n=1 Tax=Tistlia consotensis TaxID=1321365 RepID=UPI000B71D4E9
MAQLTADRNTPERDLKDRVFPVGAGKKVYAGGLVVLNAGSAEAGTTALALVCVGRAEEQVDNTGGAAGDLTVRVRRGTFRFANAAADPVDLADVNTDCFIVDDQTVAAT